jgi:hypothetical protein
MENQLKELNNIQKQITNMRERHNNNIQAINDVMTTKQKYQNGKIYAIKSFQTNDVYYGSTTKSLSKRLIGHKAHYKLWQNNNYNYVTSFEIIKYDDCFIELYELYPCNSKTELEKREGQVIRENNNAVNKVIAGRTKKEYCADNVDNKKLYDENYRENNRDKIKQKQNQYYIDNADKVKLKTSQYRKDNIDKVKICDKQYRLKNISKLKQYSKQYRIDNADNIKLIKNMKYDCICGGKYTNCHKSEHLRSKRHIQYLESLI